MKRLMGWRSRAITNLPDSNDCFPYYGKGNLEWRRVGPSHLLGDGLARAQ